jgi:hypothetical protein
MRCRNPVALRPVEGSNQAEAGPGQAGASRGGRDEPTAPVRQQLVRRPRERSHVRSVNIALRVGPPTSGRPSVRRVGVALMAIGS